MDCSICLQEIIDPTLLDCCNNAFCRDCLHNWNQVKTTCPLCTKQIGNQKHNLLTKNQNQQFDNGMFYFENQVITIHQKLQYLWNRLSDWEDKLQNFKSCVSVTNVRFVKDQLYLAQQYEHTFSASIDKSDRETASLYYQLLVELMSGIESTFDMKNSKKQQYQYHQCMSDEELEYVSNMPIKQNVPKRKKQKKSKKKIVENEF